MNLLTRLGIWFGAHGTLHGMVLRWRCRRRGHIFDYPLRHLGPGFDVCTRCFERRDET